jgi:tetratricopeptide (TPR) repeat protein
LYKQAIALTEEQYGVNSPQSVLVHCRRIQACLKSDGLLVASQMFTAYVAPRFPKVLAQLMASDNKLEAASFATTVLDLEKTLHLDCCLNARELYELASCYERLRMFDQAEPLYEKALYLARWNGGGKAPLVAEVLNGLGDLHSLVGKGPQSVRELKEALSIYGPDSLGAIVCCLHIANVEQTMGDFQTAETYYKRALAAEQMKGFRDKRIFREILLHYAALLRRSQRVSEATELETMAGKIRVAK